MISFKNWKVGINGVDYMPEIPQKDIIAKNIKEILIMMVHLKHQSYTII